MVLLTTRETWQRAFAEIKALYAVKIGAILIPAPADRNEVGIYVRPENYQDAKRILPN